MTAWLLIFLSSVVIDVGAVLFTRSVLGRHIVLGVFTTTTIAALNWAAIWLVMKQDDTLVIPSIVGHAVGYVVGMRLPLKDRQEHAVCQKCHPTTRPELQSSDPS
jgi:hypothetical protein